MIEQIIFTILSITLFVYMFYKMMKYNENEYIRDYDEFVRMVMKKKGNS